MFFGGFFCILIVFSNILLWTSTQHWMRTHQLSVMREVSETGLTIADRQILDHTNKQCSQQQSDPQGQRPIMFPSNKTALYDKSWKTP